MNIALYYTMGTNMDCIYFSVESPHHTTTLEYNYKKLLSFLNKTSASVVKYNKTQFPNTILISKSVYDFLSESGLIQDSVHSKYGQIIDRYIIGQVVSLGNIICLYTMDYIGESKQKPEKIELCDATKEHLKAITEIEKNERTCDYTHNTLQYVSKCKKGLIENMSIEEIGLVNGIIYFYTDMYGLDHEPVSYKTIKYLYENGFNI